MAAPAWPLEGIRVLELADESGEFAGRCLAGGGADVLKLEPPGGSPTRSIGPFYEGVEDPARSLFFWHYNLGKRSVTVDLDDSDGKRLFAELARQADVVLEAGPRGRLDELGLGFEALSAANPRLVHCAMTPFGQSGPLRDYQACDLVHLALGGQTMMCGYDPVGEYDPQAPSDAYDTPPITPQMWHSAHIAGLQAAFAIEAALLHSQQTGEGQFIDFSVHEACAGCAEIAVPFWIYEQTPIFRQTGRHAWPLISQEAQFVTGDGWVVAQPAIGANWGRFVGMLESHDAAEDLTDPRYEDVRFRSAPDVAGHVTEVMQTFAIMRSAEEVMEAGQAAGLPWGAVRRPEENVADSHWQERGMFAEVEYPELGERFAQIAAPWVSEDMPWRVGSRAPLAGEHTVEVLAELGIEPGSAAPDEPR
jgi:crotonobetainyl-CoA:carnitine CoA-transferase CaiB-like acyl-CoA transferase